MGGLGNQLFQIFTTIAYSIISKNLDIRFTSAATLGSGCTIIRRTYWDDFLSRLKTFTTNSFPEMSLIREKDFTYNDIPISELAHKNVMLFGYFQSYKYFKDKFNFIYDMIDIEDKKQQVLKKCGRDELLTINYLNNSISMHFRLGDYKQKQQYHPIMTHEYYCNALKYIQSIDDSIRWNILFFCENEDIDNVIEKIYILQEHFPTYTFTRANTCLDDWEHMLLMSLCRHNIIANSSFSWWGAYFNTHSNKLVCYPSVWFGSSMQHNTNDLFPPEWIKIDI
jgi:hypothetical protein